MLAEQQVDFTLFFRHLTSYASNKEDQSLTSLFIDPEVCKLWLNDWANHHQSDLTSIMQQVNPVLIPRNHQIERAIQDATKGDFSTFELLHEAWKNPFSESKHPELEKAPLPHERVKQTFCGT